MTWILPVYLVCLVYLAVNHEKLSDLLRFRIAWATFALGMISNFAFAVFRTAAGSPSEQLTVQFWADGFSWLFLGVSVWFLAGAILPRR